MFVVVVMVVLCSDDVIYGCVMCERVMSATQKKKKKKKGRKEGRKKNNEGKTR